MKREKYKLGYGIASDMPRSVIDDIQQRPKARK
jgi:hypothetical protein